MKTLDWIFAAVVFALGIVHCAVTPLLYKSFSLAALWFFSAGLALIFAGMLNVLRVKGPASPLLRGFCIAANAGLVLMIVWFALTAGLRRNPQGVVLIVAILGEFLLSLVRKR
jgi:uncharacterized membrane protein YgdD (TMEM256/DUF423 family)